MGMWWKALLVTLGMLMMWPASQAHASCGAFFPRVPGGTYVAGASNQLYNDATQVVLMREGTTTVLSMRNSYQGPPKDFAMVVPVPVVLQKENVKVLKDELFQKIDLLTAPKLVEYWELDPCVKPIVQFTLNAGKGVGFDNQTPSLAVSQPPVKVETKFKEGEYEIVVLSATESNALEQWLIQNKYNIPKGASSVLAGYVQKGMYFFVAKVDVNKVKFNKQNEAMLSPLRFHYDSDDFSLPVRLGLLNARGMQDLIIHILAQNQRYEVANAKNVTIPTNLIVDKSVKNAFASFYAALFDYTLAQNPGAVVTEYAWQAAKCDPCPASKLNGVQLDGPLDVDELNAFGLGVISPHKKTYSFSLHERSVLERGDEPPQMGWLRQEIAAHAQRCGYKHFAPADGLSAITRLHVRVDDSERDVKIKLFENKGWRAHDKFTTCLKDSIERLKVSEVKDAVNGADFTMDTTLTLTSQVEDAQQRQLLEGMVLTRLHARYNAKTLNDDLVFAKANAITGGRGVPIDAHGEFREDGAQPSKLNNFQARYAILYPWKGKVMCDAPQRARWGDPPQGGARPAKAALNLASTPRNKIKLSSVIKSRDVPGLSW